uniref:Uncharacterized protein n=1 Tax=Heterorhabditis bacteriophora TaxID=37862 RepID=A0A1I7WK13_HETBA
MTNETCEHWHTLFNRINHYFRDEIVLNGTEHASKEVCQIIDGELSSKLHYLYYLIYSILDYWPTMFLTFYFFTFQVKNWKDKDKSIRLLK